MSDKFFITTPIYYVNAKPHIGHAYTSIAADVASRYNRLLGKEVLFLTGTDEHGQKILLAAKQKNLDVKDFVDSIVVSFKDLWSKLDVSYDYFVRTTDPIHKKTVQHVIKKIYDQGDLYKGQYKGWYCTPCETFWPSAQLKDGKLCPDCDRPVEEVVEENYFFKLSKYQSWLIEYIQNNENFIRPVSRRNEILGFLKEPLEDLCVSRPKTRLGWGIEFPIGSDHVTYVWFDALINYISAIDYLNEGEKFKTFWPADFQLLGKDILRHHAVFWPIMLRALGLEQPKCIFAHGWWMQQGAKMSKSKTGAVDPLDVINQYGLDAFRYFLLREVTFGVDGTYSTEAFKIRYNSDLANDLGNLLNRTLAMIEKHFDSKVPSVTLKKESADDLIFEKFENIKNKFQNKMDELAFSEALILVWELINSANKYIEESKPWVLKKEGNAERLGNVMYNLTEVLRITAILISPFMPSTADKIWAQLGFSNSILESGITPAFKWGVTPKNLQVNKQQPLFPRVE